MHHTEDPEPASGSGSFRKSAYDWPLPPVGSGIGLGFSGAAIPLFGRAPVGLIPIRIQTRRFTDD